MSNDLVDAIPEEVLDSVDSRSLSIDELRKIEAHLRWDRPPAYTDAKMERQPPWVWKTGLSLREVALMIHLFEKAGFIVEKDFEYGFCRGAPGWAFGYRPLTPQERRETTPATATKSVGGPAKTTIPEVKPPASRVQQCVYSLLHGATQFDNRDQVMDYCLHKCKQARSGCARKCKLRMQWKLPPFGT